MSVEASGFVEIKQSPLRMLGLIAIGIVLTALCVGIAFHLFPDLHASLYQEFMGLCRGHLLRLVHHHRVVAIAFRQRAGCHHHARGHSRYARCGRGDPVECDNGNLHLAISRPKDHGARGGSSDGERPDPHADCAMVAWGQSCARGRWSLRRGDGIEPQIRRAAANLHGPCAKSTGLMVGVRPTH